MEIEKIAELEKLRQENEKQWYNLYGSQDVQNDLKSLLCVRDNLIKERTILLKEKDDLLNEKNTLEKEKIETGISLESIQAEYLELSKKNEYLQNENNELKKIMKSKSELFKLLFK